MMMKKSVRFLSLLFVVFAYFLITACVQMPTEKKTIVDMRPSISFRADNSLAHGARVVVDGLDMGRVGNYLEGEGALRILQGNHLLRVVHDSKILLEEKIYLGDGVNRTFTLSGVKK